MLHKHWHCWHATIERIWGHETLYDSAPRQHDCQCNSGISLRKKKSLKKNTLKMSSNQIQGSDPFTVYFKQLSSRKASLSLLPSWRHNLWFKCEQMPVQVLSTLSSKNWQTGLSISKLSVTKWVMNVLRCWLKFYYNIHKRRLPIITSHDSELLWVYWGSSACTFGHVNLHFHFQFYCAQLSYANQNGPSPGEGPKRATPWWTPASQKGLCCKTELMSLQKTF